MKKTTKKVLGVLATALLLVVPAMAEENPAVPNCDFQPSCEVAPGIYGKISSPVTSKFDLSIGGFVKLDYAYNSVNLGTGGERLPSSGVIPKTTSVAGNSNQSILSLKQSRFWLKVKGPTFLGAKTGGLIEADFYGTSGNAASENENASLRMRHAYGTIDWPTTQILFGQTNDIFGPMTASTVDNRGGQGWGIASQTRVAQVRLTQKIPFNSDNSLKLVLGVQNPVQDSNTNTGATATAVGGSYGDVLNVASQLFFISKALGTAPGFYGLAQNSLAFGPYGLIGQQKINGNLNKLDTWGYGLYTFVPIIKSADGKSRALTASLEAEGYFGANLAFNSGAAQSFVFGGANVTGATPLDVRPAKAYGYNAQLIFYPTQDLGITVGYGRRNIFNYFDYKKTQSGSGFVGDYQKSNSQLYANIAYDLNAAVRVAAEYQNVNTQYGVDERPSSYVLVNGMPVHAVNGTGTANIGRFAFFYFF